MLGLMNKMAKALAILGGLVLVTLIIITCLSVIGRGLNTFGNSWFLESYIPALQGFFKVFGPINGDYELVEAGSAIAIFMFLPWCQLNRGHATVELFTSMLPEKPNRLLALVWEVVFTLVIILITWRVYEGMNSKIRNGETSFLLQMPTWWPYAVCTFTVALASLVAITSTWIHIKELITKDVMVKQIGENSS